MSFYEYEMFMENVQTSKNGWGGGVSWQGSEADQTERVMLWVFKLVLIGCVYVSFFENESH